MEEAKSGVHRLSKSELKEYFQKDGTVSVWWEPEEDENYSQYYIEERSDLIRLTQPEGKVVLDMGKGRLAIALAKAGAKAIIGADISREMIKIARIRAKANGVADKIMMCNCDAEHLPFTDGFFPAVCCIQIFPHLPNPLDSMRELARVVQKGGLVATDAIVEHFFRRFVVSLYYNRFMWPSRAIIHKMFGKPLERLEYHSTTVVNSFSKGFFQSLFEKADLRVVHTERYNIFLFALAKKMIG